MTRAHGGFLLVRIGSRRVGLELAHVSSNPVRPGASGTHPRVGGAGRGRDSWPDDARGASRDLLHGGTCPQPPGDIVVVVAVEGRRIGLEIDEAEVVMREPALPVPPGSTLPWAIGVARHPEGLVPLLDLTALSARFMEAAAT